jgi:2-amino-4-hydroxy-6-hydroxymethyldihydropteridine diphosphokinase
VPRVFLGLGSNVDAETNLRLAVRELRERFGSLQLSRVCRSAAFGFDGEDFLNLVAACDTDLTPTEIVRQIEEIHALAGRVRGPDRYTSRPLDVDLLMYGDLVDPDPALRLPRNDVLRHSFVLGPLAEIAPDVVHPITGMRIDEHWQQFDVSGHPLTFIELEF